MYNTLIDTSWEELHPVEGVVVDYALFEAFEAVSMILHCGGRTPMFQY